MKKSVIVAVMALLCGIGCQEIMANNWVIVNTITVGQGAYAEVKMYFNNQTTSRILKPGDAGVFRSRPVSISVFQIPSNQKLYEAKMDDVKRGLTVLRYQDGRGVFIESYPPITTIGGRIWLVNAAPNPASYHVGYIACGGDTNDKFGLQHGGVRVINTGACITHNLHAWYRVGDKNVHTNKYEGRTGGGVFVFRKSAVDPNAFQVTGPWRVVD